LEKISQDTLAEMIGTTRSRVNFFRNTFRKLGYVHDNAGIRVYDSLARVLEEQQGAAKGQEAVEEQGGPSTSPPCPFLLPLRQSRRGRQSSFRRFTRAPQVKVHHQALLVQA
jgi:hypothetical protein